MAIIGLPKTLAHAQNLLAVGLAAALVLSTLVGVAVYPLDRTSLALALAVYAGTLWRWPACCLVVLPVVLPALDLGLWTGWMMVGESDLFVAVSIAVLLLRTPLKRKDLLPAALPALILGAFAAVWLIATVAGMAFPLETGHSDNAFLRPDNALRIAKGLIEALALLPFLRQRQRLHSDAVTLLGWGFVAGLVAVTIIVVTERALFASIVDFSTEYRVAGPFSSMRVGGGHIGAYAALALPFCLCLFQRRPQWLAPMACLLGGYTVAVTFARAAYMACAVGMAVTSAGWVWSTNRRRIGSVTVGVLPVVLVLCTLSGAAAFTGMQTRFAASAVDFMIRQDNWRAGMAVRDSNVPTTLFGMGLGTYQRAMLMRSDVNRPSDLVLQRDDAGAYVTMRVATPFFLGQKISMSPSGSFHLTLRARSSDGGKLGILICDKVLLYSDNCRGSDKAIGDRWTAFQAALPAEGLGSGFGPVRRPVELSLFAAAAGHTIELRDITLTDDAGRPLLVNGDLAQGLDRWIFTDDSHVSWRMLNEYLMLFFETGALGLAAYLALAGVAFAGGIRALRAGAIEGAAVAGAIAAFMVSGMFDNVLEAPRLATLFFLVCGCGLIQWETTLRGQ